MAVVDIRRRTGYLFLAVIVGHVILISTQVTTKRGVPMLEEAVFGVFSEVQRGANAVTSGVHTWWQDYFALQQVQSENEQLKKDIGELRVRLQQERALAQQRQSLQKLLDLKGSTALLTTGANVIAGGASPEFRTITIDKGTGDGLRADMAVIAPAGVADEEGAFAAQEEIAGIATEAGQVADVDGAADEVGVEAFLGQGASQRFAAARERVHEGVSP